MLVKLAQNPPTALGGNKTQTKKKKDLSRNDSNYRGLWVSFTDKNHSQLLLGQTQRIQYYKQIHTVLYLLFATSDG